MIVKFQLAKIRLTEDYANSTVYLQALTESEYNTLSHDAINLSSTDFHIKYGILKQRLILKAGDPVYGIVTKNVSLEDIIPHVMIDKSKSYKCYGGADWQKASMNNIIHESSTCAFHCAVERLGKPKFCFMYSVKNNAPTNR